MMLEHLAVHYPMKELMSFTVAPSEFTSDWPLEDYNSVLAVHNLIEYAT